MKKRTLFFSDNPGILSGLVDYARHQTWWNEVDIACSPISPVVTDEDIHRISFRKSEINGSKIDVISFLRNRYDLIISGHCKQIFPPSLVETVRCVNLHPGYNPETRGWYPQVFSIIRGHKIGFTVHIMDEQIDSGPIIYREEVPSFLYDTSLSLYSRVVEAEISSIPRWLPQLREGTFQSCAPESPGNYFSRKDFDDLLELDLEEVGTFQQFFDRLRALSFPPHRNAFITDPNSGERIFLELSTRREL